MKESDVLAKYTRHLEEGGWEVPATPHGDHPDVDARHIESGQRLVAELKGHTAAPGLDVDTAYGQLLRRMPPDRDHDTRYALVVPESLRGKVERVPEEVRRTLRIEVWLVPDAGAPYSI